MCCFVAVACYWEARSPYTPMMEPLNTVQLQESYMWQFPEDLECDRLEDMRECKNKFHCTCAVLCVRNMVHVESGQEESPSQYMDVLATPPARIHGATEHLTKEQARSRSCLNYRKYFIGCNSGIGARSPHARSYARRLRR